MTLAPNGGDAKTMYGSMLAESASICSFKDVGVKMDVPGVMNFRDVTGKLVISLFPLHFIRSRKLDTYAFAGIDLLTHF